MNRFFLWFSAWLIVVSHAQAGTKDGYSFNFPCNQDMATATSDVFHLSCENEEIQFSLSVFFHKPSGVIESLFASPAFWDVGENNRYDITCLTTSLQRLSQEESYTSLLASLKNGPLRARVTPSIGFDDDQQIDQIIQCTLQNDGKPIMNNHSRRYTAKFGNILVDPVSFEFIEDAYAFKSEEEEGRMYESYLRSPHTNRNIDVMNGLGSQYKDISERSSLRKKFVSTINTQIGGDYVKLGARENLKFDTMDLHSRFGIASSDARKIVILFHGMGAYTSHTRSFAKVIPEISGNAFAGNKSIPNAPSKTPVRLALESIDSWIPMGAIAPDLMGHGQGPYLHGFPTFSSVTGWITEYIKVIKSEFNLPVVVISKSASPVFLASVAKNNPGLIEKLVLISPAMPGDSSFIRDQSAISLADVQSRNPNNISPAWGWNDFMLEQTRWTENSFTGNTPTLIMVGGKDPQVLDVERYNYFKFSKSLPNVYYVNNLDVGHDVLFSNETDLASQNGVLESWKTLYMFLNDKLVKR